MDESAINQNRRSRRSNLLMQATLESNGRALNVTLRNLSADGARIEGDQLPIEGSALLFRKGEIAVPGRIIWIGGRQAGIEFDHKLDPRVVLNHMPAPRARAKPDFRRPALGSRKLTPEERSLGKHWFAVPPIPTGGD
ncbi:MAG TPA: PilZ domain-containing protein [Sphingomicrobium sp.]|nr:PilZ domain-containing protein [Sphingomicrobium sp.]